MFNRPESRGLSTDETGIGHWRLCERTGNESRLEVTFSYPDGSVTTTTGFLTGDAIPGTVVTEAGVFLLTGDERGGDAEFVADANYVTALQALGRRIYAREMLACGMFQVPLDYTVQTLKCWSNAKIAVVAGMYLLGITQDEIATALVDNPSASPMDVIAARMPSD